MNNETPVVYTALFGGRGQVRVFNLLGTPANPFTAILSCELAPDGVVGPHVQEEFPEVVIGMEGDGVAVVDRQKHVLRADSVVYLPLGSVLSLENRSSSMWLKYLIIKARV